MFWPFPLFFDCTIVSDKNSFNLQQWFVLPTKNELRFKSPQFLKLHQLGTKIALNHLYLFSVVTTDCTKDEECTAKNQICGDPSKKCECKDDQHEVDTEEGGCKPKGRKNFIQSSIMCFGLFHYFLTAQ